MTKATELTLLKEIKALKQEIIDEIQK